MRTLRVALLLTLAAAGLHAGTFTVTNTNGSGPGSLFQAVTDLNASGGPSNTIAFSIGSGPVTINLGNALPGLYKPVVVDGTTQPGYSSAPIVEIDGGALYANGVRGYYAFLVQTSGVTIKGLVLNNFSNRSNVQGLGASAAIDIRAGGTTVIGCRIGTDLTGTVAKKNDVGVRIQNGANGNTIGTPLSGNLISGNYSGIESTWTPNVLTGGTTIQNNSFGFDAAGAPTLVNYWDMYLDALGGAKIGGTGAGQGNRLSRDIGLLGSSGVVIQGNTFGVNGTVTWSGISIGYGSGNTIGGTAPGAGNTFINGPWAWAVDIQDSSYNVIQGNSINGYTVGVGIYEANYAGSTVGNQVGGTAPGAANTIRNCSRGITLVGNQAGTQILGNSITGSGVSGVGYGGGAIDLNDDGHTANDSGDADSGPNGLQNYPTLTTITSGNGTTTIAGTLNSKANGSYRLEFFSNASCHASGYGEGETFLGAATVNTDGAGNGPFVVTLPGTVPPGRFVAATATDAAGNTSEFSVCMPVTATGAFQFSASSATVGEGAGNAVLTVSRISGAAGTATINYATLGGTATAGADFTAASGTLSFGDGETSKTISVPILQDAVYEGNESFSVALSAPGNGALLTSPSAMTVTILDDDVPSHATIGDVRIAEGNAGTSIASFNVVLDQPSANPASVQWTTSPGTATAGADFTAAGGTLNFAVGETQKTIPVAIIGDTTYEPDETFTVTLSTPVNLILDRVVATGTIVNDDAQPVITADDVTVTEGNAGTVNAVIKLKSPQPLTATVNYSTVDDTARGGSDYVSASGTVEFNNETEKQISVAVTGDTTPEPDERFHVHLSSRDAAILFARPDVVVTIANDDAALLPSVLTLATGQSGNLTVDFGNPLASAQTLAVSKSDACIKVPDSVTVNAGQRSAAFAVDALTGPCSARVDMLLPPALGGKTLSAGVRTYPSIGLTFDPASPQLVVGQSISVIVTSNPSLDTMTVALASASGTVQVPATVEVGPSGGTFTMKALRSGAIVVSATLPAQFGGTTFSLTGTVSDAPPTATVLDVTPKSGATTGGTPVSIAGQSFTADCAIAFDGAPAANFVYVSTVLIIANTPAHKPGAVDVTATCGGKTSTLKNGFVYTGGSPDITSVDPASGTTAGGTTVRIGGRDLTADCWVEFGGELARNVTVASATEMIATTPAHAAGAVTVKLRCGGGAAGALPNGFTYVTSAEPNAIVTGVDPLTAAPGQQVRILGSRFRPTDSVTFDAMAAQVLSTTPDAHVVVVPSLPPGKVSVTVASSTTGPIFTVLDPEGPKVTKMSPVSLPQGAELTIDGSGFRPPYAFRIGGTFAQVVSLAFSRAVIRVPVLVPGNYEVDVMNGDAVVTAGGHITVSTGGIVVTGATPPCISTDGGSAITVTGNGFLAGATVTIDGIAATDVKVMDTGHIEARTPALPPGLATIVVTNPSGDNGSATNAVRAYSPLDPDGCAYAPRLRPIHR